MKKTNQLAFFASAAAILLTISASGMAHAAGVKITSKTPRQGDTIEVVLPSRASAGSESTTDSNEPPHEVVTFNGHQYKYFPVPVASSDGGGPGGVDSNHAVEYKALLAVPADLDPGKYPLKSGDETFTLTVRAGVFPLQHIHLAPSKDNFDTAPGEEEAVERAKSTVTDTRYWTGPFSAPSKARTSTGFGLKRMVNGRLLKDYFHSGLDYAGALGSPILACSGGKVVLVGRGFKLHGNTVAIDHGQGVISFYIHMKTIKVAEGDVVKAGQQIGTVGQTGRATGPHLHFSIYVNKVAANPSNWFATTF